MGSLDAFKKVLLREIERIFTNKDIRLMAFVAPFLYGVLMTAVYTQGRLSRIDIGVIDNDNQALGRAIIRNLDATEGVHVAQRYLNVADAEEALARGDIHGILHIPTHFSSSVKRGLEAHVQVAVSSSNFMIANPVIQGTSDVTLTASAAILASGLMKKGLTRDKAMAIISPIDVAPDITFNPQLNYSDFIIPALLFAILQQIILVSLAFTMADEHENKRTAYLMSLSNDRILPLIIGKAFPYLMLNMLIALLFMFVGLPFFGLSVHGSLIWSILYVFSFVLAVTGLGMMISALFKTTAFALITLMFYSMPAFLMSGVSWPASGMSLPNILISGLFPSTFFFRHWRLLVLGDIPISKTLGSFAIMMGFALITFLVTFVLYRKQFRDSVNSAESVGGPIL